MDGALWLVKPLPEKTWLYHIDEIVMITAGAGLLLYILINLFLSYRRNRFCPNCRTKMVMGWRTEKRGISNPRVRIKGSGIKFSTGVDKIAVLRCPQCGWEIDLGK